MKARNLVQSFDKDLGIEEETTLHDLTIASMIAANNEKKSDLANSSVVSQKKRKRCSNNDVN